MSNPYLKTMKENGADGIDFIPFGPPAPIPQIIASYTKEELEKIDTTPRSCYRYWKIVNGTKVYI